MVASGGRAHSFDHVGGAGRPFEDSLLCEPIIAFAFTSRRLSLRGPYHWTVLYAATFCSLSLAAVFCGPAVSAFRVGADCGVRPFAMSVPVHQPTIKDIARAAGMHFTTVSLALRGKSRIAVATRERVARIAGELGYNHDPVAMALTSLRSGARAEEDRPSIVFISNNLTAESFADLAHMQELLAGARRQAERYGFRFELLLAGGANLNGEALDRHLAELRCEGIVLGALHPGLPEVVVDWSRYALAKIDSRHLALAAPFVSNDQMQVVRLAFQRTRALGYRRIGLMVGRFDEEVTDRQFSAGWLIEQEAVPAVERIPILHYPFPSTREERSVLVREWVRRFAVDAVLCNLGAADAEYLAAAILGSDTGPVGYAMLALVEATAGLAGVVQDCGLVGTKAVEMVAAGLRSGRRGESAYPSETYVPARWCDGASLPPR